jgi:hypothetical protein
LAPTTPSTFSITNSFISDINGTGIDIRPPASAGISGLINGVTVKNTITGIALKGFASTATISLNVQVINSVVDNASAWGFYSATVVNHPWAYLHLRNVSTSNDGVGVYASGSPVWLTHSIISESNSVAYKTDNNGAIYTYGDNVIDGGYGGGNLTTEPMQ